MGIVIADTGAIISLIHIGKLNLIEEVFGKFYISKAVWIELNNYDNPSFERSKLINLESCVKEISSKNYLLPLMDYGEAESSILYEELNADYLLIDDNKARKIAESFNINCIGTLGLLLKAREKGLITELKPVFEQLLKFGRYFSVNLLNNILTHIEENNIV